MTTPKPVALCILDGWGLREDTANNAPALADTPNFDRLIADCPNNTLITFGPDVGLPKGQMGNSEVGHTNIGAGRVVAMDLGQIDLAIEDGSFAKNPTLLEFIEKTKSAGGTAHLMGLLSDGGVHGHINHTRAAIEVITGAGVPVALHVVTDGRDVAPRSVLNYLHEMAGWLPEGAYVATVCGRYFAMDRDNRWERIEEAYNAMIRGQGAREADADTAVHNAYNRSENDEFVTPTVIGDFNGVQDGDSFACLNFRADRAREILRAIGEPGFAEFDTGTRPALTCLMGMVDYSDAHNDYMTTMYPKQTIVNTLGEWVAKQGLRQFRLAETEKYPHVTFFLNGGKEQPEVGEDRHMPSSPKVATYDLAPEMSAAEVTEKFLWAIDQGYDLIVTNYANPDMVGHTGDLKAAMAACEAVDQGLGQVMDAIERVGGALIVTADHGNCETMVDPDTGGAHTAHTTNLVPVALFGGPEHATLHAGRLADLAPTVLELMNLPQPEEMTGQSLIDT